MAANPSLIGNVAAIEALLKDTALKLGTSETCGGTAGQIPNNVYGSGRIDAFQAALGGGPPPPTNQPPSVSITSPGNGDSFNCETMVTFTGTASDPEQGDLSSSIAWTSNGTSIGTGASVSKTYSCAESGDHTIVARVTDNKGLEDTDSIVIHIVNNSLPAAPSNLTASVSGSTVTLNWQDNADNEAGTRIERKGKGKWLVAGSVGSNVTTSKDTPGSGKHQYRAVAFNKNGSSAASNIVSVTVK